MANEDKQNKNKYTIKILGDQLIVIGDISEEYIKKVTTYINKTGEDIKKAYPRLPHRRLFGLAIVNITDEYFKLKEKYRKICNKLEEENKLLQEKNEKLQGDYNELLALLEEVD